MDERIDQLIQQLTLDEKISLLAGKDMWRSVPLERLGISSIKVTDGPNGARGEGGSMGPTSACFPCGSALGATWNTELVERLGQALAEEVKAKGAHILLAPTVNIHRSPLAGRNFECYSEDPYLSGQMASAYISGLQSKGVGACIKHFVCNDSEFERNTISSEVGERALREIYLEPFRIAIEKARPWAVMSAYNRINGIYACENDYLLKDILKGEWGFEGIVISDWFGTYGPGAAKGGLDLEMPGPARWTSAGHVRAALASGALTEAQLDDKVRRILRTITRVDHPKLAQERAIDRPEHRALIRQAAGEAIVLLENSGVLPFDTGKIKTLAVIGENARWAQIVGGGSANVFPHYVISPLDGIRERAGAKVSVQYAIGCATYRSLPAANPDRLTSEDGRRGLTMRAYPSADLTGEAFSTQTTDRTAFSWFAAEVPVPDGRQFSVRLNGTLTIPESGAYRFGLESTGRSRLRLDGKVLIDNWEDYAPNARAEKTADVALEAGKACRIEIEYAWQGEENGRGLRFGLMPALPEDPIAEAVALAQRSDAVVIVAGLTNEWESEGFDRASMDLPGDQNELISRVAAANPNTVVVLNAGSPLAMPWLDQVAALLQLWYPGQESGHALADVLFGDVNPCGKLPTTFPKRLQDNPAYINYPGENGRVLYGEGIFVGYRYYDKKDIEPLFPFGHGLSYTTFEYSDLEIDNSPDGEITVSVKITNTGKRAGKEIVQLYLGDVESRLMRPEKELKRFAKVALQPGETREVAFTLDRQALAYYDPARKAWVAEAGTFEVLVGASSGDIRLRASFSWQGDAAPPGVRLHP